MFSLDMINKETTTWMYRNARPIDLARYQFHFENGSQQAVIDALAMYQNEDGGFGHGLEADSWNPNSAPIQTWVAMELLKEIGLTTSSHPIIQGVLNYLASGKDFNGHCWANAIPTNNDYPRAPWWTADEHSAEAISYNPTAYFAGVILAYADPNSDLYQLGVKIAQEAVTHFLAQQEPTEMHVLSCYIGLFEYCTAVGINNKFFDLTALKDKLEQDVATTVTADTAKWETDYVCKPSHLIKSPNSSFYPAIKEIAQYETKFILKQQNKDGTWLVPWDWQGYEEFWPVAKVWWQGDIIVKNLLYLRAFKSN